MISGGGAGSGKTTVLDDFYDLKKSYDAVYDTTLKNKITSAERINQALKSGRDIDITYVYRPFIKSFKGAVQRAVDAKNGITRTVPIKIIAGSHTEGIKNIFKLRDKYSNSSNINFRFYDNSGKIKEWKRIKPNKLKEIIYGRTNGRQTGSKNDPSGQKSAQAQNERRPRISERSDRGRSTESYIKEAKKELRRQLNAGEIDLELARGFDPDISY